MRRRDQLERSARAGIVWLLELQNDDGGWPTFYLQPAGFRADESGSDTTARALRALSAWRKRWSTNNRVYVVDTASGMGERIDNAIQRGCEYLESAQQEDGRFVPLWFGNEQQPEDQNPVVGVSEVLLTCADLDRLDWEVAHRALRWLLAAQHSPGGWGPPRAPRDYSGSDKEGFRAWRANEALAKHCSVEETSLAVSALLPMANTSPDVGKALSAGLTWLVNAIEQDSHRRPAIIGFYPSKIWYHERLYPLVFAAGALAHAVHRSALEQPAAVTVS
jgi:squalene-hopene/tetraprenyl-beta-curcumene cyclase